MLFAGGASAFQSPRMAAAAVLVAAYVLATTRARRLLDTGRPEAAALWVGGGMLAVSILGVPLLPFLWPAQVLVQVLGVGLVLPWLRGRTLAVYMAAAWACAMTTAAVGMGIPQPGALPPWSHAPLLMANLGAVSALTLLLLWSFAERQRAALDRLAESEERFRTFVTTTSPLVWRADAEGRTVAGDEAWQQYTDRAPESWTDSIHPEDRAGLLEAWDRAIEQGSLFEHEYRLQRADGRWVDLLSRAAPIRGADGAVHEWLGAVVDVSDLRDAQRRLQLEARRKDEFIALLAHELRNPLAPISMALQLLRRRSEAPELEIVERQVRQLVRIVDDLLDVSRVSRGKIELRPEVCRVAGLVREAVESCRPLLEARGHALTVDVAEDLFLRADPVRMVQVLLNLLTNAARYTAPGGRVAIGAERRGGRILLRVRDNGRGIEPDLLPDVFEPFVQGDDREHGGLGIGLTLVHRLVALHGGEVSAQSEGAGAGSVFTVDLPASEPLPEPPPPPAGPRPRPRKVLVIDDNVDALTTLARFLEEEGHSVRTATEGGRGIDLARSFAPEVVLLDLAMPGMDGFAVARELRGIGSFRIVALTGYGQTADRVRTEEAGFSGHLVKPVDPDRLRSELSEELGTRS